MLQIASVSVILVLCAQIASVWPYNWSKCAATFYDVPTISCVNDNFRFFHFI